MTARCRSGHHTRSALLAVALTGSLLLNGCGLLNRDSSPTPTSPASTPAVEATPSLISEVTPAAITEHLKALQQIADSNGGNRAVGQPGYAASVAYVKQTLTKAGYTVTEQPVDVHSEQVRASSLEVVDGAKIQLSPTAMSGSGSTKAGGITAPLARNTADPLGCTAQSYAGMAGKIALVDRGTCPFGTKAAAAQEAGVAGLLIHDTQGAQGPLRGDLQRTFDTLPVAGLTQDEGKALLVAMGRGALTLKLVLQIERTTVSTTNVLAELPGQASSKRLMVGAHLDSVPEGPGLNDNGSGVALLLSMATALAGHHSAGGVRFAFWGAEELGLLGSQHYVRQLSQAEREQVVGYLNFDMVASPNGALASYGNGELLTTLNEAVTASGGSYAPQDLQGRSDHAAFAAAGISTAGIFTGAEQKMSKSDADQFGGKAGEPYDPCYHQACDDLANTQSAATLTRLGIIAQAAIRTVLAARPA